VKFSRFHARRSVRIPGVDTRAAKRTLRPGEYPDRELPDEPGLERWIKRNPWLLVRLFMVLVFSFGATTTAANFSYGLEINPIPLSAEQINEGRLPPGADLEDFVEITGTPNYGENTNRIGTEESAIGFVTRYSANYFYFELEETGDSLIIQTAQTPPDVTDESERVWRGKLSTVGTVIFHDTTIDGLENAGLTTDGSVPIVETGDTPNYYRQIFPAYATILGLWLLSIAWLLWKRNKPFLDE
jgi:hypothetical protein